MTTGFALCLLFVLVLFMLAPSFGKRYILPWQAKRAMKRRTEEIEIAVAKYERDQEILNDVLRKRGLL